MPLETAIQPAQVTFDYGAHLNEAYVNIIITLKLWCRDWVDPQFCQLCQCCKTQQVLWSDGPKENAQLLKVDTP